MINEIINKDCLTGLKELPDCSVDCCVTSPPYYGLRDYGHEDQAGLEETPELYVENMVAVFNEVRRVLKKEGTLWLNLGDSYNGSGGAGSKEYAKNNHTEFGKEFDMGRYQPPKKVNGLKAKDLIGIPWLVAFALRSSGWYLRQDIIWSKPNPMPESVTDRCTKAHEYVFLLSKSEQYYYDNVAIQELANYDGRNDTMMKGSKKYSVATLPGSDAVNSMALNGHERWNKNAAGEMIRNKRSVWTVTTRPYSEAHFATFPERLIIDMIKAGCPEFVCSKCGVAREMVVEKEFVGDSNKRKSPTGKDFGQPRINTNTGNGMIIAKEVSRQLSDCGCNAGFSPGIVLDPFMGAGTTALVARKLGRNYIGFEINPDYIKIANKRLKMALGMFL